MHSLRLPSRLSDSDPSPPASLNGRSFRVPATAGRLTTVRGHVDDAAAAVGLGPKDRHGFVVAVNEAATNAIKHGRPYPDGTIVLRIELDEEVMMCSISDSGQFAYTPNLEPDLLAERGRGFKLMALLADVTEVSSGARGTTVCLKKRRPATTQQTA